MLRLSTIEYSALIKLPRHLAFLPFSDIQHRFNDRANALFAYLTFRVFLPKLPDNSLIYRCQMWLLNL